MFSGGIERDQWHEMSKVKKLFICLLIFFSSIGFSYLLINPHRQYWSSFYPAIVLP